MKLPLTELGPLQEKQVLREDQKSGLGPVNFGMSERCASENAEGGGSRGFKLDFQEEVGTEI